MAVDLGNAEREVVALALEHSRCRECFAEAARLPRQVAAHNANGKLIERRLHFYDVVHHLSRNSEVGTSHKFKTGQHQRTLRRSRSDWP